MNKSIHLYQKIESYYAQNFKQYIHQKYALGNTTQT